MGLIITPAQLGIKMIPIQASHFTFQGKPKVRCNGFQIAETPFTNRQFRELLRIEPDGLRQVIGNPKETLRRSLEVAAIPEEAEDCPLVYVDWNEAASILNLCGRRRLPTELEYERVAAGLNGRIWPWGNDFDPKKAVFNDRGTRSVRLFADGASEDGVLHLAGNVWQWTNSVYGPINLDNPENPIFPQTGEYKILRGGSWYSRSPAYLRAVYRDNNRPENRYNNAFGFRAAEDIKLPGFGK